LSTSCFLAKIFAVEVAVNLRSCQKTSKIGNFWDRFLGEATDKVNKFCARILNRTHFRMLAGFGDEKRKYNWAKNKTTSGGQLHTNAYKLNTNN